MSGKMLINLLLSGGVVKLDIHIHINLVQWLWKKGLKGQRGNQVLYSPRHTYKCNKRNIIQNILHNDGYNSLKIIQLQNIITNIFEFRYK